MSKTNNKCIAFWMSDKKLLKFNLQEFESTFKQYGFTLYKLDLEKDLLNQGTFCVFLHKLTDIIALADQGDSKCANLIKRVEEFIKVNPYLVVLDPLPNVRQLLNRYISYKKITCTNLDKYGIFTPTFCELNSASPAEMAKQLRNSNVSYPFICKPCIGHGSKMAHQMSIIFNERNLIDCKIPCVAQSFICHNAVLYKIFIVGDKHHYVDRPSIKNLQSGGDDDGAMSAATIHFDSAEISKAGSKNSLTEEPENFIKIQPDADIMKRIADTIRDAFGMDLLGVDVVIENSTGKYAIIDINAFPGYDGYPDLYQSLLQLICSKTTSKSDNKKSISKYKLINSMENNIG